MIFEMTIYMGPVSPTSKKCTVGLHQCIKTKSNSICVTLEVNEC